MDGLHSSENSDVPIGSEIRVGVGATKYFDTICTDCALGYLIDMPGMKKHRNISRKKQ